MRRYNVAVVGATGLVGRTFLQVMEEYGFPVGNLRLFASERSAGSKINYCGQEFTVEELSENSFEGADIALFSAGGAVSEKYAPIAAAAGAVVIDNSSRWRMENGIPLIVPEINIGDFSGGGIIANPNCSTIQSVLPLYPLKKYGLKRVCYTTYQAVSGSGQKGKNDLFRTLNGDSPQFYPHDISKTCIPEIDVFLPDGYTKEERKMIDETRKILHMPELKVSATCVRVPVPNSHAVAIAAEFENEITVQDVVTALEGQDGVTVTDRPQEHVYPVSTLANGQDEVLVGRIRKDLSCENGILMYSAADNIRKGAAANAVQIAMRLIKEGKI